MKAPIPRATRIAVWERDGNRCVACGAPGTDIHHRQNRGSGGTSRPDVHRMSGLLLLCNPCNVGIESNAAMAEQARIDGVKLLRHQSPDREPVLHHGRWVLLSDDGSLTECPGPQGHRPSRDAVRAAWADLKGML